MLKAGRNLRSEVRLLPGLPGRSSDQVRYDIQDHCGNIFGRTYFAKQDAFLIFFLCRLVGGFSQSLFQPSARNKTGSDGVDPDLWGKDARESECQIVERGL